MQAVVIGIIHITAFGCHATVSGDDDTPSSADVHGRLEHDGGGVGHFPHRSVTVYPSGGTDAIDAFALHVGQPQELTADRALHVGVGQLGGSAHFFPGQPFIRAAEVGLLAVVVMAQLAVGQERQSDISVRGGRRHPYRGEDLAQGSRNILYFRLCVRRTGAE